MTHLCDSGVLDALTPDDTGILKEWTPKYAIITDQLTSNASLSIYATPGDTDGPEVVIQLEGSDVQISKQPNFERCFTVTTSKGLRIFLRAASITDRDSWVYSLKHAKKSRALSKRPSDASSRRSSGGESSMLPKACGYVFLWEEAGQRWLDRFLYVSAGYLHEFDHNFRAPVVSHDLSQDCAIRMRGNPPCVEVRLGTGEILRFLGQTESETMQWLNTIKTRSAQQPQPFTDLTRASFDASSFENDGGALSFFVKPDATSDLMAGVPSSFTILGSMMQASLVIQDFSAFLTMSRTDKNVQAQGSFHALSDQTLGLKIVHPTHGTYALFVRFRGRDVFGSPFQVTIHSAVPSAPHSLATGSGLVRAPMPEGKSLGKFAVRLRDRYLNFCEHADSSLLQVNVFGPAQIQRLVYVGDGSFEAQYKTVHQKAPIEIEVKYAGIPLAGSPFTPVFSTSSSGEPIEMQERDYQQYENKEEELEYPSEMNVRSLADQTHRAEMEAVHAARQVTEKTERVSQFISSKIRQDWAENQSSAQLDNVFPQDEQLELLLASSSLRATNESDEPEYLREHKVEVETDQGQLRKWEPEPLPPPWASMPVVQAYVRRVKKDLLDTLQPLIDTCKAEQQAQATRRLEPVASWKRCLVDWPSSIASITIEMVESLKTAISVSPLTHRRLICAMCDAVIRAQKDIERRIAVLRGSGAPVDSLSLEEQAAEEEEEIVSRRNATKPMKNADPREELRKRVQSLALGRNLHRPVEPLLLSERIEKPIKASLREQEYGERVLRMTHEDDDMTTDDGNMTNDDIPLYLSPKAHQVEQSSIARRGNDDEETNNSTAGITVAYEIGDRIRVDGRKLGTVRHVGPTRFAPGLWIGVELDEQAGKNSGSINGVQYFACKQLHGIFVKPDRVAALDDNDEGDGENVAGIDDEEARTAQKVTIAPGSLSHIEPRELISVFKSLCNDEGLLSREAFVQAFKSIEPRVATMQALALFDVFDVDESRFLGVREFVPGAIVLCGGERDDKILLSFQLLDLDGSGYLDAQELESYVACVFRLVNFAHPNVFLANGVDPQTLATESVRSAMQAADPNGDGRVSFEEFRDWMLSLSGSKQQQQPDIVQPQSRGVDSKSSKRRVENAAATPPTRKVTNAVAKTPSSSTSNINGHSQKSVAVPTTPVTEKPPVSDWLQVEKWLTEDAGVHLAYEIKATLEQFRELGVTSLVRIARLTAVDINRLNLSFDLRLRLITQVRALAKSLVFEASERKLHLSPLHNGQSLSKN